MHCDNCAAEPASFDHLDLSGGDAVFKRLCRRCADAEKAVWDAERCLPTGLHLLRQGLRERPAA